MASTVSLACSLASYFSSCFFKAFSTACLASFPAFFPTSSESSFFDDLASQPSFLLSAAGHAAGAGTLTTLTFGSSSSSLAIALRTDLSLLPDFLCLILIGIDVSPPSGQLVYSRLLLSS